ncbi:DUF6415 family natural product biosynthesis protein [Streptomyces sp. APSN-46.1]|uniref:DUF6415 family natural product biosynthesis protein n=1 Tax=Streptomyces sp. APSN-46.1 TaxID=2929049 RepID=UPI001FB25120|nr:DUF6415 family natural product biosynthesis protein [Streptomyces sp. APSN-46.1]MCJ1677523.1 DUF6415 family natural product biosynthesis protein [Streptomyces sp. APSN-46.1]
MASTRADLTTGTALVTRALVPYAQKPNEPEIAALVDDLLTHGAYLTIDVAHLPEAAGALDDWHTLTTAGPEASALGNWSHCRALARTVRTMHRVLVESACGTAFVGRPGLPPLAPERGAGHPQ